MDKRNKFLFLLFVSMIVLILYQIMSSKINNTKDSTKLTKIDSKKEIDEFACNGPVAIPKSKSQNKTAC